MQFNNKFQNATADHKVPHPTKAKLLSWQRYKTESELEQLCRHASSIFDQKERGRTLIMAVDEYLLNFLQLSIVGHRSPNTLEKMIGRKKRLLEFLTYKFNTIDLSLDKLQYQFIDQYYTFLLVQKT